MKITLNYISGRTRELDLDRVAIPIECNGNPEMFYRTGNKSKPYEILDHVYKAIKRGEPLMVLKPFKEDEGNVPNLDLTERLERLINTHQVEDIDF